MTRMMQDDRQCSVHEVRHKVDQLQKLRKGSTISRTETQKCGTALEISGTGTRDGSLCRTVSTVNTDPDKTFKR